jgi:ABC-2 type transport system permease protein
MRSGPTALGAAYHELVASGVADYRAVYTLRSWLFGWVVRLIAQVTYFGLLGVLVGSADTTRRVVLGNVVLLTSVSTLFAVSAIARERQARTVDLLLLARVPLAASLCLRNVVWVGDGVLSAVAALGSASAIFGLGLGWQTYAISPVACLLAGLATLGVALTAGCLVLDRPTIRALTAGVITAALAILGGVNYPLPSWLRVPMTVLPVSAPITVLQRMADGRSWALPLLVAAFVVIGWWLVALWVVHRWQVGTRLAR